MTRTYAVRQLDRSWAMSLRTRAAAASRWSLFHVSSRASIAIAVFAISYFAAALVSAAGQ